MSSSCVPRSVISPFFQYHYLVGILYGAQAVRHDDHRFVLEESLQIFLYHFLIVRIERIRRFIKKQVIGITVNGARYQDALLLPLAQSLPRVTYFWCYTLKARIR